MTTLNSSQVHSNLGNSYLKMFQVAQQNWYLWLQEERGKRTTLKKIKRDRPSVAAISN